MPDATDRRLVDRLLADGRSSMRELGDQIGVSATTVSKRLRELEANGAINGYQPIVDYDAFGYRVTAIVRLKVDGTEYDSLVRMLCASNQFVTVYEVTGQYDVVVVGKFTTTEQMDTELKRLLADSSVREANSSVALNVVREHEQFPVSRDGS